MENTDHVSTDDNNFSIRGIFSGFSNAADIPDATLLVINHKHGQSELLIDDLALDKDSALVVAGCEDWIAGETCLEVVGSIISNNQFLSFVVNSIKIGEPSDLSYARFVFTGTLRRHYATTLHRSRCMIIEGWRIDPEYKDASVKAITENLAYACLLKFIDSEAFALPPTKIGDPVRITGIIKASNGQVEFHAKKEGAPLNLSNKKDEFEEMLVGFLMYDYWKRNSDVDYTRDPNDDVLHRIAAVYMSNMDAIGLQSDKVYTKEVIAGSPNDFKAIIYMNEDGETLQVTLNADLSEIVTVIYDNKHDKRTWQCSNSTFREFIHAEPSFKETVSNFFFDKDSL
ncbi:hypothetical protein [uncultured Psychrobacter sp.]|uniref:hypothetical protein n=1 Tax=uncultured Psychrobacter sp. TaxID=259303 RepID=UPI0030DBE2DF